MEEGRDGGRKGGREEGKVFSFGFWRGTWCSFRGDHVGGCYSTSWCIFASGGEKCSESTSGWLVSPVSFFRLGDVAHFFFLIGAEEFIINKSGGDDCPIPSLMLGVFKPVTVTFFICLLMERTVVQLCSYW
jgi:hypothetical protein